MNIRSWQENDLPQITCLLSELDDALGEDQCISMDSVEVHFKEMGKNKNIYRNYVCEDRGEILGFISLLFYRSVYHKVGTALVNELIVKKDKRNERIGSMLFEYAIQVARKDNMDEIEVGVMIENQEAVKFYKRHGMNEEYLLLGMQIEEG
jgi:ribosomal protein S18 acetylase RimI-like enzyme